MICGGGWGKHSGTGVTLARGQHLSAWLVITTYHASLIVPFSIALSETLCAIEVRGTSASYLRSLASTRFQTCTSH